MDTMPEEARIHCNGFWFVFRDGADHIRAWGSYLSGTEKVYFNGQQVSQRRSVSRISEHRFEQDGHTYTLTFNTRSYFWELECSLSKDGIPLDSISCHISGITPWLALLGMNVLLILLWVAFQYFVFSAWWIDVSLLVVAAICNGLLFSRLCVFRTSQACTELTDPDPIPEEPAPEQHS